MKFRARVEGSKVLLNFDDRTFVELEWQNALQMSAILRSLGKQAEEIAKVDQVIADGAILDRAGFPIGLSSNPKIRTEIRQVAQHDRDLRRDMPAPSIASREVFGTPTINLQRPEQ